MSLRRKRPEAPEAMAVNTYWFPFTLPAVQTMLTEMGVRHRQFLLFGEVYGSKIQDLH